MFTVDKCCCCFPLRWGALAIAIIRLVNSLTYIGICCYGIFGENKNSWELYVAITFSTIFIIICILLIVSIWVQKGLLVLFYLIYDFFNIIINIVLGILHLIHGPLGMGIFEILAAVLFIYFWMCVLSWFVELDKRDKGN